jgi:hypothetical protein
MRFAFLAILAAALTSSTLAACEPVSLAAPPQYIVLPADAGSAYVIPSNKPRYAYGWFGAQSRTSWSRHFGYYRNYTQWKWK